MPQYLSPGVYVEEVPSAVQPIAGVGTSTAGFIGIIPDSILIPERNPLFDPTMGSDAIIEVDPAAESLLGQAVAAEVTVTAVLAAGTLLTASQAEAIASGGGSITVSHEQPIGDALLGKTLAENVVDSAGNLVTVTIGTDQIELRQGHLVAQGQVGTIRDELVNQGIQVLRVQETLDMAHTDAAVLIGKTLDEDITLEMVLPAGSSLTDGNLASAVSEASAGQNVRVLNQPALLNSFELPAGAGQVKLVTNFGEFKRWFGDFSTDVGQNTLAHAVYGFFNNGGTRCFVVREESTASIASSALAKFAAVDEIAIVAAPGMTDSTVRAAIVAHCKVDTEDRFAIFDSPEVVGTDEDVDLQLLGKDGAEMPDNTDYGAFYFPWIQVFDPALKIQDPSADGLRYVPPSGHMAGIYARVDTNRGVHKAPANEVVMGALGLKYQISKAQQDGLNPHGVNVIRDLNGNIRVWGARTIGGDANGEWKYVNVRRLFLFLRESIDEGTQWVVFEPNAPELWAKITRNVSAFLTNVWRDGALFGTTPQEAFYVKCDAETNPPEVRDLGQVITEIGVAVVKPAEFVIFRISQWAGPGS